MNSDFELTSDYWELWDGHGQTPDHEYEKESFERLLTSFPFLNHCPSYLNFLKMYAGLSFEPLDEEDSIGTIWGIGVDIPHLLDDEGSPLEENWFHFADIYDYERKFTLAFYFDSTINEETVFVSLKYSTDHSDETVQTFSKRVFAENFVDFWDKIISNYPSTISNLSH